MEENPGRNQNLRPKKPFSTTNQPEGRGRPKGSLSLTTLLRQELSENKKTKAKTLIKAIIKHAEAGSSSYGKMIFDRIDGIQLPEMDLDDRPILVIMARTGEKESAK